MPEAGIRGPGIDLDQTCMACPEQYEGTVDGNPAYFRLRHGWWRFCIIEPGGNPVGPGATPDKKVLYYNEGQEGDEYCGVMQDSEGLILRMIDEFRGTGPRDWSPREKK